MIKPIPGFPDYFADKKGNIYSCKTGAHSKSPRLNGLVLLTPRHCKNSPRSRYNLCVNGRHKGMVGAVLVLITFVSQRPKGMLACHGKRGSGDDSLDNIYWATSHQNSMDQIRDGTAPLRYGEHAPAHVLNNWQVRVIRRFAETRRNRHDMTITYLAHLFGCSVSNISYIVHNRTWAHI